MSLSVWPFCWCTWGILCSTSIPFSFIRVVNALDVYSPPASDIHFCTLVLKIVSTMTKKYLVACNAASLVRKLMVQAWEECQEIGLVALMFFFELLFPYVSFAISLYVFFTNLF